MRCSACYGVGITVSFCSVEHQKLVSESRCGEAGRRRHRAEGVAVELIRFLMTVLQIWCTHKAICGRVLTEPFVAPYTEQEHLAVTIMVNTSGTPKFCDLESFCSLLTLVHLQNRPARSSSKLWYRRGSDLSGSQEAPCVLSMTVSLYELYRGGILIHSSTVPQIYRTAFQRQWLTTQYERRLGAPRAKKLLHGDACARESLSHILIDQTPLSPDDYISGPSLPPAVLPYILFDEFTRQVYRQDAVSRGTNAVAYLNKLIVYATVASRYLLDPTDSPSRHRAQLQELATRVMEGKDKVEQKGTSVRPYDDPSWTPEHTQRMNPIDWSFHAFESMRKILEGEGNTFPRLR
jgi:hypothetical protein